MNSELSGSIKSEHPGSVQFRRAYLSGHLCAGVESTNSEWVFHQRVYAWGILLGTITNYIATCYETCCSIGRSR